MPTLPPELKPTRLAHAGVLALMVGVLGGVVAVVTLQLRSGLHGQILRREADTLAAVAAMQLDLGAAELGDGALAEVPGALLSAVLKTSRLRGVSGVRIFAADRQLNSAWPFRWTEEPPAEADWRELAAGGPVVRLRRAETVDDILGLPAGLGMPQPALEAWVPLRRSASPEPLGVAQFLINGGGVAADLEGHDRRLWLQAGLAWLAGSVVIVLVFGWALRRLGRANRELSARSEDLQRANRELVLAAKTSALGAVTAHLFHELKNPLAGLEVIVAGAGEARGAAEGGELAAASELTRRLRTMVNDVVGVLRDEQTGARFTLTPGEVGEIVQAKVAGDAAARGVRLETAVSDGPALAARPANLATLVLRNLLQNALEATPAGGLVRLAGGAAAGGGVVFSVDDSGPGLPLPVRERLFQPCASSKPGGSGLGLALSHQLAQQAGGRLELARSDARGTSFRLVLPAGP